MKSKRRKIFYVALSILIAATIWFYVNNKESVTVYVHDVPIEFLNEDTSLADKGLMRISGDEDITVDLKLQMPRNVVYDFDTSELRLVSDLSTITYAGKQSVSYTILYPSKVSSNSVKVESPTIRTVQVEIGELNKKDVEIRCKVVGNVAEGYIAGYEVTDAEVGKTLTLSLKYGANRQRAIQGLRRISKPGLRVYAKSTNLPKVLGGLGVAILSTSSGLLTDKQAESRGVGGEVLAYVW